MKEHKSFLLAMLCLLFTTQMLFAKSKKETDPLDQKALKSQLKQSNQAFIENKGQIDIPEILYYGKSMNNDFYLTKNAICYVLKKHNSDTSQLEQRLDIDLQNANPNPQIVAEKPLIAKINYYLGRKQMTDIASFKNLIYKDVYPNIDMKLYIIEGKIRYDFIVHPGGNPKNIQLKMLGVNKLFLDNKGNVIAQNQVGQIQQGALKIYQGNEQSTIKGRFKVKKDVLTFRIGEYDNTKDLIIDPTVDPQWDWGQFVGGELKEVINKITIDNNGNLYCIGTTSTNINPISSGGPGNSWSNMTAYGVNKVFKLGTMVFVGKYYSSGELQYLTYYGPHSEWNSGTTTSPTLVSTNGDGNAAGTALTLNNAQDFLYCVGNNNKVTTSDGTSADMFIIKLNASNLALTNVKTGTSSTGYDNPMWIGSPGVDVCKDIKCDNAGHLYLVGKTTSHTDKSPYPTSYQDRIELKDFNVSGICSVYQCTPGGVSYSSANDDGFLLKLTDNTTTNKFTFEWCTYIGSSDEGDVSNSLSIYDGSYWDPTKTPTPGINTGTLIGVCGVVNAGVGTALSGFVYPSGSSALGGGQNDFYMALFDENGQLKKGIMDGEQYDDAANSISYYTVQKTSGGIAYNDVFWNVGGYLNHGTTSSPDYKANINQFSLNNSVSTSNPFSWSSPIYLDAYNNEQINAVLCDNSGNTYVTGSTSSTSGLGFSNNSNGGPYEAFLAKYDINKNLKWGVYYGGIVDDYSNTLAMDLCGDIYIGGTTSSTHHVTTGTGTSTTTTYYMIKNPTSISNFQIDLNGDDVAGTTNTDGFLARYSEINTAIANEQTICYGSSVSLGAAAIPGYTYSWTQGSSTTPFSTSSNPTVTPTEQTTYTLTMTIYRSDGITVNCRKTRSVTIHVLNACVITSPNAYCGVQTGSINLGTGCVNESSATYSWSPSTGLSATNVANPTLNLASLSPPGVSYTLTTTYGSTSCTSPPVNIVINPIPINYAGPDQTICLGNSVVLGSTSSSSTYSYLWSCSSTKAHFSSTTVSNPTVTFPTNATGIGTYVFTLIEVALGCSATYTVNVIVSDVPTSPGLTCVGPPSSGLTCTSTPTVGYGCNLLFKPTSTPTTGITFYWYSTDPGYNPSNARALPSATPANSSAPSNTSGNTWLSQALLPTPTTPQHIYVISTLNNCWSNRLDITASLYGTVAPDIANYGSTYYVCSQGGTTTLTSTASSGYTYEWHRVDPSTGNDVIISGNTSSTLVVSQVGLYYFKCTSTLTGCTNTSLHSVNVTIQPDLTISPAGPISSASTLTATTTGYVSSSYQWYEDGNPIAGAISSTLASTFLNAGHYYYCTAVNTCGQRISSNIVRYNATCPAPSTGTWSSSLGGPFPAPTSTPPYNYSSISVSGAPLAISSLTFSATSIDVASGTTLTINGSTLNMYACGSITVNAGATLAINNTTINSCGTWQGINVKDGGTLTFFNSTISDAIYSIYGEDGANIHVANSTFKNNLSHIVIKSASSIRSNPSIIETSTFSELVPSLATICSPLTSLLGSSSKMIYLEKVDGVQIRSNTISKAYASGSTSSTYSGIEGYSTAHITLNSTNNIDGGLDNGVYFQNGSILNMDNNNVGMNASFSSHPFNGLILNQVDGSSITSNSIGHCGTNNGIGVQFYQNAATSGTTYFIKNSVNKNKFGFVLAPDNNPVTTQFATGSPTINSSTNQLNVQLQCNTITNNDVAIIGSGNISNQNSIGSDAGNIFYSSSPTAFNNDWDILWQGFPSAGVSPMTYNENSSISGTNPNVSSFSSRPGSKYYLNFISSVAPILLPTPNITLNYISTNYCSGIGGTGTVYSITGIKDDGSALNLKVFPNPFYQTFNVEFDQNVQDSKIEVLDLAGRVVITKLIKNDSKIAINASNLAAASYILRVTTHEGKIYRVNLVKSGY